MRQDAFGVSAARGAARARRWRCCAPREGTATRPTLQAPPIARTALKAARAPPAAQCRQHASRAAWRRRAASLARAARRDASSRWRNSRRALLAHEARRALLARPSRSRVLRARSRPTLRAAHAYPALEAATSRRRTGPAACPATLGPRVPRAPPRRDRARRGATVIRDASRTRASARPVRQAAPAPQALLLRRHARQAACRLPLARRSARAALGGRTSPRPTPRRVATARKARIAHLARRRR